MDGDYVLDTNIFVAYFNGEPAVIEQIIAARDVIVPVVALGELQYGAAASNRPQENHARIRELLSWAHLAVCDDVTAQFYGRIKAALRLKGRPIPDNDMWIAATAMQFGLPLASRDEHFRHIDNLDWHAW